MLTASEWAAAEVNASGTGNLRDGVADQQAKIFACVRRGSSRQSLRAAVIQCDLHSGGDAQMIMSSKTQWHFDIRFEHGLGINSLGLRTFQKAGSLQHAERYPKNSGDSSASSVADVGTFKNSAPIQCDYSFLPNILRAGIQSFSSCVLCVPCVHEQP